MASPQTFAAFAGGGGLPAPSVASAFQDPGGIPDSRGMAATEGLPIDALSMLRAGTLSAEELLRLVAMLAGLGAAPPTAPIEQGSEVQQALLGGGLQQPFEGGPQPF